MTLSTISDIRPVGDSLRELLAIVYAEAQSYGYSSPRIEQALLALALDPTAAGRVSLTPEQLARRKHCVGASEAAAVDGRSPWETPFTVWLRKVGPERAYRAQRPRATQS